MHCCFRLMFIYYLFFFNDTATTEIYTLSLHDALPICHRRHLLVERPPLVEQVLQRRPGRSEEHTSELQSPDHLVCRLLLEKKNKKQHINNTTGRKINYLSRFETLIRAISTTARVCRDR